MSSVLVFHRSERFGRRQSNFYGSELLVDSSIKNRTGFYCASKNVLMKTLILDKSMGNLGSWRTSGREGGRLKVQGEAEVIPPKDLLRFQCSWTLASINLILKRARDTGFKSLQMEV